jgi:hypothetical protein
MFIILILSGIALMLCARAIPDDFNFPQEVDDLKSLPKDVQGLYIKNDAGKFGLDPVLHKRLDTSALSSTLDKVRKENKNMEKMVAGFKSLGLGETPEEAMAAIKEQMEELEDADEGDSKKMSKLKQLRESLKSEFEDTLKKTVGEKDEQLTKMQRSLHKNMVEREAIAALAKYKGSSELLLPHVISKLSLVEDDGDLVVRVVDKDGDPVSDGKGGYKSVEQFVLEMRNDEKFSRAFDASGRTGSGSKTGEKSKPGSIGESKTAIGKIASGLRRFGR